MDLKELEERADKALNFLAETDAQHAQLKARVNILAEHRKAIVAAGYFGSLEKGQESKRQDAHQTEEYLEHLKRMEEADIEFMTLNNRRSTATTIIDMYRTVCANQRRGS